MPVIVKLGGSLADSGGLESWLALLRARGGGRVVIVPGGGGFAEAVRTEQKRLGFSDLAAHRMAVLAMEQYALLLLDLAPDLSPCVSPAAMRMALAAGRVGLWLPSRMVDADPTIATSWDITSDSLAAWLARRIAAEHLVLVKSTAVPPPPVDAAALAARGIVDPAFPAYAAAAGCTLTCCGPGDEARLLAALAPSGETG